MGDHNINFEVGDELYEMIDAHVDESLMFDNRSQFIRAAVRTYLAEKDADFSKAQ